MARRCDSCDYPHISFLPHEDKLRYLKLWADLIIASGILILVIVAIKKRGLVKTATAKVP